MNITCPNPTCAAPALTIKDGKFRRKDDGKTIQRFRCKSCAQRFSRSTLSLLYRQKKRRVNYPLLKLLASGVSLRRSAFILGVSRKTVERKLIVMAAVSRHKIKRSEESWFGQFKKIQLDDLITKEKSKLKPLSVTIAIDEISRRILAVEVSQIPAFGHLAQTAIKKYGTRPDQHNQGLERVFHKLSVSVSEEATFKTDEHPRYSSFIKTYFPKAKHLTYKSERASVAGQGELKKLRFDPLFAVNHTCAMLRANVNRLIRKTWCTTKDPKRLKDHLDIFVYFYNQILLKKGSTPI